MSAECSAVYFLQLEDGASKIETPQQKLQRLQHEIRELGEEVHAIQENVKKDATAEKISPVDISKQLQYLQHQLSELQLEKLLGSEAKVDLSDPQGQLQKLVMFWLYQLTWFFILSKLRRKGIWF